MDQDNPQITINQILKNYSDNDNNFFFIQIGSNDRKSDDPIYPFIKQYKWKGILIELTPYFFEKLKIAYKDCEGLSFENVAIDKEDGYRDLFRIKENAYPENPRKWFERLGSFKKEIVAKHKWRIPNFEKNLITEKVKCLSFNNLLNKYNVTKINLLHIDTEGYDYEIIKSIPFNKIKPYMILYEHKHLNKSDKEECKNLLDSLGYSFVEAYADTLCYKKFV